MPGDVGRDRREWRRSVGRQKAVRIVLDNRDTEAASDLGDRNAARLRDRMGGGIEQRRIEIERLRAQALAGVGEGIGIDALVIHRHTDEPQPELRRDRTSARISQRFRQDDVAGLGQQAEDAEQRRMRTRA